MNEVRISHSALKHWRTCQMSYYYKNVMGIKLRAQPHRMLAGNIIHSMIEEYQNTGKMEDTYNREMKKYKRLMVEEQEDMGDIVNNCKAVFDRYIKHYEVDTLTYLRVGDKATEFKLEVEFDNFTFVGKLDAIVVDQKNNLYVMDHKCVKKIPDEKRRYADIQLLLYYWVLKEYYGDWLAKHATKAKLNGIIWDYLRTKPPTVPQPLKRGGLSRNKNIDTDYDTYYNAIVENDLDPDDYQDMLSRLDDPDKFFKRIKTPQPVPEMVENVVNDMIVTASEIVNVKRYTRNQGYSCTNCQFFEICSAEVRGVDADYILKSRYVEKKGDNDE